MNITGDTERSRLRQLFNRGDYDGCLEVFRTLAESRPLTADELVQKSRCVQLGSGTLAPAEEAEDSLNAALALAEEYVPAILELAWFRYAVRDDSRSALALFERAAQLAEAALEEARQGEAECREDLAQFGDS